MPDANLPGPNLPGANLPDTDLLPETRRGTIPVMAASCGVMVANIYVCQPLLAEIARNLGVSEHAAGFVAVAAQVGYALGILLVVPLADVAEPRRLVRIMIATTTLALLAAAVAPGIPALVAASLVIAAAAAIPQLLIPLATSLALPQHRGRVIGALQTGLILGILLSRTVSGAVASAAGNWRASYLLAAVLTAALFLVLPPFMPRRAPLQTRQGYLALLRSLPPLLALRPVRISAGLGFCLFGAFSALWATLAFHLASPAFGLDAAAIGLFGVWGAPGAVLAPLAGRLADRIGPNPVNAGSLAVAGLAFVVAFLLGGASLLAVVVVVNLLDFGVQSSQVANQARIFALGADIRARLNTVYMVATFGGGAFGSLAGAVVWSAAGWSGVCALCLVLTALAAIILAATSLGERRRR